MRQRTSLQVATEDELIGQSEVFEQAMNQNALAQFCQYKVSSSEGKDQETWMYLRVLFEADPKRCVSDIISVNANCRNSAVMGFSSTCSVVCLKNVCAMYRCFQARADASCE